MNVNILFVSNYVRHPAKLPLLRCGMAVDKLLLHFEAWMGALGAPIKMSLDAHVLFGPIGVPGSRHSDIMCLEWPQPYNLSRLSCSFRLRFISRQLSDSIATNAPRPLCHGFFVVREALI